MSLLSQVLAISGLQAVYDPSDLTSLYQSRTGGSTGAVDSVVGIMLDKKQMGGKTAAAFIAGQSELVTNGDGSAAPSAFGNVMTYFQAAGASSGGTWNVNVTVASSTCNARMVANAGAIGNWHLVSFTVNIPATFTSFVVKHTINGATTTVQSIATRGSDVSVSYLCPAIVTAADRPLLLEFANGTNTTDTIKLDNVSVKAIPGYHALAPSDAARPILRAGYVDCDGTDDWMQIFPTLNLGEQWWHVGGWKNDGGTDVSADRAFALSNEGSQRGAFRYAATNGQWRDTSATWATVVSAPATNVHVATLEQTSTTALTGRINGGTPQTITPYDDSGSTQGLALFSGQNDIYTVGLDGRFYGGAFGTGTLSSADRALLERYVAGLSGVTL